MLSSLFLTPVSLFPCFPVSLFSLFSLFIQFCPAWRGLVGAQAALAIPCHSDWRLFIPSLLE